MLQAVVAKLSDHVEALARRDVPYEKQKSATRLEGEDGRPTVSSLLQLGKDPRLDERSSRDHDAVDAALLDVVPVGPVVVRIAVSEYRDWSDAFLLGRFAQNLDALADVCGSQTIGR